MTQAASPSRLASFVKASLGLLPSSPAAIVGSPESITSANTAPSSTLSERLVARRAHRRREQSTPARASVAIPIPEEHSDLTQPEQTYFVHQRRPLESLALVCERELWKVCNRNLLYSSVAHVATFFVTPISPHSDWLSLFPHVRASCRMSTFVFNVD